MSTTSKGYVNPLDNYKPSSPSTSFDVNELARDSVSNLIRKIFGRSHGEIQVVINDLEEKAKAAPAGEHHHTLEGLAMMAGGLDPFKLGLYGVPEAKVAKPKMELVTIFAQHTGWPAANPAALLSLEMD